MLPVSLDRLLFVELAAGLRDHHRCHRISDNVSQGARLRHEAVDTQQYARPSTGIRPVAVMVDARMTKPAPETPPTP